MKSIESLKCWPVLKENGFMLKDVRNSGIITGRGAYLMEEGVLTMEIEPAHNNRWRFWNGICVNYVTAWELSEEVRKMFIPQ